MSAHLIVDRAQEKFGADITIADLAMHSFPDFNGNQAHIYEVWEKLEEDWPLELDRTGSILEPATGVAARFSDGSILYISAWAECCDGSGCRYCRG